MAVKPRKKRKRVTEIDETVVDFLLHGDCEKGTEAWSLKIQRFFEPGCIRKVWAAHKKTLIADWVKKHPCSRPFCWWIYDAPRDPVKGWDHSRFDSAQRMRLGGTGTPLHEVSCVWSGFDKGIPSSWVTEDYKKAGFKGQAIDPNDPPSFEPVAAFLKRHDILTPGEMTFLKKNSKLMEPEVIEFEDE